MYEKKVIVVFYCKNNGKHWIEHHVYMAEPGQSLRDFVADLTRRGFNNVVGEESRYKIANAFIVTDQLHEEYYW